MKKWIPVAAIVTLLLSVTTFAETKTDEARNARRRQHQADVSALMNRLELTAEQRQQMEEIHRTSRTQASTYMDALQRTSDEIRAARAAKDEAKVKTLQAQLQTEREAMVELRKHDAEKLFALLTPEQRAKLEALKGERAAKLAQQRKEQQKQMQH
jgi:Spy/CpxP family protein refolding chaperone